MVSLHRLIKIIGICFITLFIVIFIIVLIIFGSLALLNRPIAKTDFPIDQAIVAQYESAVQTYQWKTYKFQTETTSDCQPKQTTTSRLVQSYAQSDKSRLVMLGLKGRRVEFCLEGEGKTPALHSFPLPSQFNEFTNYNPYASAVLAPNGQLAVFWGPKNQIAVYTVANQTVNFITPVTPNPGEAIWFDHVSFAPDSQTMYVSGTRKTDTNLVAENLKAITIYKVNAQTGQTEPFIESGRSGSVSPDGKWLAYISSNQKGREKIQLLNLENSVTRELKLEKIDSSLYGFTQPAPLTWTPDSRFFLFHHFEQYGEQGFKSGPSHNRNAQFIYNVEQDKASYYRDADHDNFTPLGFLPN